MSASKAGQPRKRYRNGIIAVVTLGGEAQAKCATVVTCHRKMARAKAMARWLRSIGEDSAAAEWAEDFVDAGGTIPGPMPDGAS